MSTSLPIGRSSSSGQPTNSVREALETWAAKPKLYLTAEELSLCQKNPVLAATVRGPELLACIECGYLAKKLDRHVRGAHGRGTKEYREKWPGAEVLCPCLKVKYTNQVKPSWTMPRELRRKPAHRLHGKARPDQQTIPETRLAELTLEGMTFDEMATALGRTAKELRGKSKLLERLGFPRRGGALGGYIFEHGEPITGHYIKDILEDFGISQRELARDVRIHHVWLGRLLRNRRHLPLRANTARKFRNYRRRRNADLLAPAEARATGLERAQAIRGKRRQRYLLRSEVRDIPERYAVVRELLGQLCDALRRETIKPDPDGIFEWLRNHSRFESAESLGGRTKFRRLLYWWLELRKWLEENPGALLRLKPFDAAHDFLAFDYETTRLSVEECVSGMVEPLDPARARELTGAGRKKPGPRGQAETQKRYWQVAEAVEKMIPICQQVIEARRSLPRTIQENRAALQRTLLKMGFSTPQVRAGLSSKTATIAGRHLIAETERLQYDVVVKYHKMYRRSAF